MGVRSKLHGFVSLITKHALFLYSSAILLLISLGENNSITKFLFKTLYPLSKCDSHVFLVTNESRHEKTCLWGFQPGSIQMGLTGWSSLVGGVSASYASCHEIKKVFPSCSRRTSCQLLAKEWALNTGKLPLGGLPWNSVVK